MWRIYRNRRKRKRKIIVLRETFFNIDFGEDVLNMVGEVYIILLKLGK